MASQGAEPVCANFSEWPPAPGPTKRVLPHLKSNDDFREHKAHFPKGCNKSIFLACIQSRFSHLVHLNKQLTHSKENKWNVLPWGTVLFLIVWCLSDRRNILRCELPFVLPSALKDGVGVGRGRGGVRLFWVHPAREPKCKVSLLLLSLLQILHSCKELHWKKWWFYHHRISMQCSVIFFLFFFKQVMPLKMELKDKGSLCKK